MILALELSTYKTFLSEAVQPSTNMTVAHYRSSNIEPAHSIQEYSQQVQFLKNQFTIAF